MKAMKLLVGFSLFTLLIVYVTFVFNTPVVQKSSADETQNQATDTPTDTTVPTNQVSPTVSATGVISPTSTITDSPTPTNSVTPSDTPSVSPTDTITPTPSDTTTPTPTSFCVNSDQSNNNSGNNNYNCNSQSQNQNQNQYNNNNQVVNITYPQQPSQVQQLPSTGTPLDVWELFGSITPLGFILRKLSGK